MILKLAKIAPSFNGRSAFNGMSGCPISQSVSHCGVGAANRIRAGQGLGQVLAVSLSGQSPRGFRPPQSSHTSRASRGVMMRRRSSSNNSSVDTCDRTLGLVGAARIPGTRCWGCSGAARPPAPWVPRPPGWCRCCRVPRPACFRAWRRCRAGLTHAVLDVGQGAHGELQAVGQIGAVAVAQRYAPTHDVVAEPFQGASIHASIMTHEGGKVESPCPFVSICRTK